MKLILISGPSCVGKTTIINGLHDARDRYYYLAYDKLKWQISKYNAERDFEDVQILVTELMDALCRMKYNILCDSALHKDTRGKLVSIAQKYNYEVIEVNLEAAYPTLLKRFNERLENSKLDPTRKISNFSPERHRELYDIYMANKNPNVTTFHTDEMSPEEIIGAIVQLM